VVGRVKYIEYDSRILATNQKEYRKEETNNWFQNEKICK